MTGSATPATTEVLASFFKRLEGLEEIVRIVMSHYRMSALFTFRGTPEKKVLLDFSRSPAKGCATVSGSCRKRRSATRSRTRQSAVT